MAFLTAHRSFRNLFSPSPPHLRSAVLLIHSSSAAAVADGAEDHQFRRRADYPRRLYYDEEQRLVRVTVWWDFENCNIPVGVNVFRVVQRITGALRSSGIKGPVTINAFGDVAQLSRVTQEAITSTGVCLTHVPHCGKNSSDRNFMADLVYWVSQNPPPMHFFLISGDKDFANILHRLRMSNYNILLASNNSVSEVLCSSATIMWPWNALVRGENFTAKHFNHPPDGMYGSWYGCYRGNLDDPFIDTEQPINSQGDELTEQITKAKPRPIPIAFINGVHQILRMYPEGINLSDLRGELKRNNVNMEKDFFGYKKFSSLLLSLPSIIKFIPSGEGQPVVIAKKKVVGSAETIPKLTTESEGSNSGKALASPSSTKPSASPSLPRLVSAKDSSPYPKETSVGTNASSSTAPRGQDVSEMSLLEKIRRILVGPQPEPASGSKDVASNDMTIEKRDAASAPGENDGTELGFLKRIWRSLTGNADYNSRGKRNVSETGPGSTKTSDGPAPNHQSDKIKAHNKVRTSSSLSSTSSSLSVTKSLPQRGSGEPVESKTKTPEVKTPFFSKMLNNLKFWKSTSSFQDNNLVPIQEVGKSQDSEKRVSNQENCQPELHDLFSNSHFWDTLQAFLVTAKGSDLVQKSMTREDLMHRLRKEGQWFLQNLKESHLLLLVHLLIVEKKLVEESPSQTYPFKVINPAKRSCTPSHAHSSNGLSSSFTARPSRSNFQRFPEQSKHDQNLSSSGAALRGMVDSKMPPNIMELKAWFQKTCNGREDVDPQDLQKLFESQFKQKLDSSYYGYSSTESLIETCLTDVDYDHQGKKTNPPPKEEILSNCRNLLLDLFKENPEGFNMSIFPLSFSRRYGYNLDYESLGYTKLASLFQRMPEARIESTFVLPAHLFNSRLTKELTDESDSEDGMQKNASDLSNKAPTDYDDSFWDELGPESTASNSSDDCKNKEQVVYPELLSEADDTDSDDDRNDNSDRQKEESSFLQILSSYSNKGGDNLLLPNSPQPMFKPYISHSFVKESADKNERLVDSILASLKKGEKSRLQS